MAEATPLSTVLTPVFRRITPPSEEQQRQLDEEERKRLRSRYFSSVASDLGSRYGWKECYELERYESYHPNQAPVLARVKAIAAGFPERATRSKGVVFYGSVGTGKDHLLAWLLYQAAHHAINCRWVNGLALFNHFYARMHGKGGEDEKIGEYKRIVMAKVLAISDPSPPIGSPSEFCLGQLAELLEDRYRNKMPTWLTLNALNPKDIKQRLSSTIYDRLCEGAEMIPCFWPSYRTERPSANE